MFVFWDPYYVNVSKHKFILLSEKDSDHYNTLVNCEESIEFVNEKSETVVDETVDNSEAKNPNNDIHLVKQRPQKPYFIKILNKEKLGDDIVDYIRSNTDFNILSHDEDKCFIEIENKNNFSLVGVIMKNTVNGPISIKNIKYYHKTTSFICKEVGVGVLNTYNTFVNNLIIRDYGIVFINYDEIVLYVFSKEKNFKIVFDSSSFDKNIVFNKKSSLLCVYLVLKRYPSIYMFKDGGYNSRKFGSNEFAQDFYIDQNRLNSYEWIRCSVDEVPFVIDRYDFRVEIDISNKYNQNIIRNIILDEKYLSQFGNSRYGEALNEKENEVDFNDDENNRAGESVYDDKIKLYDQFDALVRIFCAVANLNCIFSSVILSKTSKYSYTELKNYFQTLDPLYFYYIMCLLSQKCRMICFQVTEEDLVTIKKSNIKNTSIFLIKSLNDRFKDFSRMLKLSLSNDVLKNDENTIMIRSIVITPLSYHYQLPSAISPNRILREFDHTKFIKVSLRDENCMDKLSDGPSVNLDFVFEFYRRILKEGFFVGKQKYFFLSMTSSQMKQHSTWFVTPYFYKDTLIGPDYMRDWLGDFSKIKNIGKYATRLGQPLSNTQATINIYNYKVIDDVVRNNYMFTDGVGVISYDAAQKAAQILNLDFVPSAFQIRMAGFKGVLVVHQQVIDELNNGGEPAIKNEEPVIKQNAKLSLFEELKNSLLFDRVGNGANKRTKIENNFDKANITKYDVIFRKSMDKFKSNHNNLEVITYSTASNCYLNRQIIMLLEGLGVDLTKFMELQDHHILNILTDINKRPRVVLRKLFPGISVNGYVFDLNLCYRFILKSINKNAETLSQKNKILINNGVSLIGVIDELKILGENEIFLMVKKKEHFNSTKIIEYGNYAVVKGDVVIAKNPCHHPGDIRMVKAIDDPRLHYLKDVLVFSVQGERPVFNMCSGSDLDGDVYSVIWDENLMPKKLYPPIMYESFTTLTKDAVSMEDIVNFYIRFMRSYNLGKIANAHMVNCDRTTIFDENSILLADIFNKTVDFPRTGFCASVPEGLVPTSYPDFMEVAAASYKSFKALGILYRRSLSLVMKNVNDCQCKSCLTKIYNGLPISIRNIIKGINIEFRHFEDDSPPSKSTVSLQKSYYDGIYKVFYRFGIKDEDGFIELEKKDPLEFDRCAKDVSEVIQEFVLKIEDEGLDMSDLYKLSRCVSVNNFLMPWYFIQPSKLKQHYKKGKLFDTKLLQDFPYNGNILIQSLNISDENVDIEKKASKFLEKKGDTITVVCDEKLFEIFKQKINTAYDAAFSEVFNILYAAKFFTHLSFDLVFVFFLSLQKYIKSNDRIEISKALLKFSRDLYNVKDNDLFMLFLHRELNCRDKIFFVTKYKDLNKRQMFNDGVMRKKMCKEILDFFGRILVYTSYALVLDVNILYKISGTIDVRNYRPKYNRSVELRRPDKRQIGSIIISGMFDQYDKTRLDIYNGIKHRKHFKNPVYTPILINKGYSDMENYKESLKEMFLKLFFDNIYAKEASSLGKMVIISVIPGKFYITKAPIQCINNVITLKELSEKIKYIKAKGNQHNEGIDPYFLNYSEVYDPALRDAYIAKHGIVLKKDAKYYTLSLHCNGVRYQFYLENTDEGFTTKFVTKRRKVLAKFYALENYDTESSIPKDVSYEVISEDLIFDGRNSIFSEEESKLFSGKILHEENNRYRIDDQLVVCSDFRLEVETRSMSKSEDPICLVKKKIYVSQTNLNFNVYEEREVITANITGIEAKFDSVKTFCQLFDRAFNAHMRYFR